MAKRIPQVTKIEFFSNPGKYALKVDLESTNVRKAFLALPSGGDTSYAGLCWHEDMLWVSYFSSHEQRTSVYLARVKVPEAQI